MGDPANVAEILRASQKDEYFIEHLQSILADIIQKLAGTRTWLYYHKYLEIGCEGLYYAATTLALRQTVGEEYTGILLIDGKGNEKKTIPSILTRVLMVVLQCGGPFAVKQIIKKFEHSLKSGPMALYFRPEIKLFILRQMPILKSFPAFFLKVHLTLFYLNGNFLHFSKRLTSINYVLVRNWFGDSSSASSFRVLGLVLLVNLLLSLSYSVYDKLKIGQAKEITPCESSAEPHLQCPLCLGKRKGASVTPCGHLFCWTCIHEWLQTNIACPLCRHQCHPSRIVPLMNYQ